MKVVVCVKRIGSVGDEVELAGDRLGVDPDYLDHALNEWDSYAVEEALRLAGEDEVVAVTAGGEDDEEALRRALAMGAARAVRVRVDGVGAADPVSVARALAEAVRAEEPGLVLCGAQSSDLAQGATGAALAELLGLPCVAVVTRVELAPTGSAAAVHRELEGGLVEVVEVDLPCVLAIQTGINRPRYATLRAIKQAEREEIAVREPADAGGGEPAARLRRLFVPPRVEGAEMLDGGPAEIARRIREIVDARLSS